MEILTYLWFILYGLVIGVLAKTIFPGKDRGGLIPTVALGICGSILGGTVLSIFGIPMEKGFSLSGLIPAFIGALIILFLYRFLKRKFT